MFFVRIIYTMWIYILVFVLVVALAVYLMQTPRGIIVGGKCDVVIQQRQKRRPRGSQIGKNKSILPPRIMEFRTRASPCTVDNPKGLCRELVDYYVEWRERLIRENPDAAEKTMIVRHKTEWCPYCVDSAATWSSVLNEYMNGENNLKYTFIENDEDVKRTPGIRSIPTIVKFDGKRICATLTRDYNKLLEFVRHS